MFFVLPSSALSYGVNFNNVLRAAFTLVEPESHHYLFMLLGSAGAKALLRRKSNPYGVWCVVNWQSNPTNGRKRQKYLVCFEMEIYLFCTALRRKHRLRKLKLNKVS